MATTTPNYAWVVPTSSDLVKNGATAIETLGDSADQSLWNSGYGQAGKNKLINADFKINQRAFTSTTTTNTFGFDRFAIAAVDGTTTYSAQTFTAGAAPVAGYESINYARLVTTGQTLTSAQSALFQKIEDVRTFAGQPVTVSFWAQAGSGTPKIAVALNQNFGSGGSATVINPLGSVTISTSWVRYSLTITVPSVSGKTIGASSFVNNSFYVSAGSDNATAASSIGIQSNTFNIWGVQAEYGTQMTPFQTASGGSIQGELAMCQRYLPAIIANNNNIFGFATSTTTSYINCQFPVTARVAPTGITIPALSNFSLFNYLASSGTPTAIAFDNAGTSAAFITVTTTAASPTLVGSNADWLRISNANGYILFTGCEF
jgi:hypothetical protein